MSAAEIDSCINNVKAAKEVVRVAEKLCRDAHLKLRNALLKDKDDSPGKLYTMAHVEPPLYIAVECQLWTGNWIKAYADPGGIVEVGLDFPRGKYPGWLHGRITQWKYRKKEKWETWKIHKPSTE